MLIFAHPDLNLPERVSFPKYSKRQPDSSLLPGRPEKREDIVENVLTRIKLCANKGGKNLGRVEDRLGNILLKEPAQGSLLESLSNPL